MGLFDVLRRKPRPMPVEGLSTLTAATASLSAAGIVFSEVAGICLKAAHGDRTGPSRLDLTGLLSGAMLPARYELATDEYGCTWIILRADLPGVAAASARTCELLNDAGYGGDILCIAFEFRKDDRKVYWIYDRAGRFYPFATEDHQHDVRFELHMKDAVSGILPMEDAVSRWFPIWGMPF